MRMSQVHPQVHQVQHHRMYQVRHHLVLHQVLHLRAGQVHQVQNHQARQVHLAFHHRAAHQVRCQDFRFRHHHLAQVLVPRLNQVRLSLHRLRQVLS
jgi:hypothetical protein